MSCSPDDALMQSNIEQPVVRQADGHLADDDFAGIRPHNIQRMRPRFQMEGTHTRSRLRHQRGRW
jgi:hypothetical protein